MDPLIQIRDLHHAFGQGTLRKAVLQGVSAEIHRGEIVLLTGPSGAGKTTILTLIGGLRSVQGGSVRVFDEELFGASAATLLRLRRRIGFIFQSPNLLDALTACQNVALPLAWSGNIAPAEAQARALARLAEVGLAEHAHKHPAKLSGGQRQRVAIARALVVGPSLILADEPTSALDKHTGREVVELLQRLAQHQKCTVLLVTHDPRILDIADRTLSLEDGRLVSHVRDATKIATQLTAGVAQMARPEQLTRQLANLDEAAFFRFLDESTAEMDELRTALQTARAQLHSTRFDQLLIATTFKAGQLLQADRVTLFVIDAAAGKLRSRVAQSGTEQRLQIELDINQGVAGYVARTGEVVRLRDAYESPMFSRDVDRQTGYHTRSLMCLPVRNRSGQIVGVAQVLNRLDGGAFDVVDENRFREFLEPIGNLLENLLEAER